MRHHRVRQGSGIAVLHFQFDDKRSLFLKQRQDFREERDGLAAAL